MSIKPAPRTSEPVDLSNVVFLRDPPSPSRSGLREGPPEESDVAAPPHAQESKGFGARLLDLFVVGFALGGCSHSMHHEYARHLYDAHDQRPGTAKKSS